MIFKHWSENSTNSGSCMAAFIASYLLSALSMECNNCLRWGLQRRSLSSFDWPVGHKKRLIIHVHLTFVVFVDFLNVMLLMLDCYLGALASAEALCQWCHLHLRDPQQSTVLQKDNDTANMTTVKVEGCFLLVFAVILCTKVLTSSSNTKVSHHFSNSNGLAELWNIVCTNSC